MSTTATIERQERNRARALAFRQDALDKFYSSEAPNAFECLDYAFEIADRVGAGRPVPELRNRGNARNSAALVVDGCLRPLEMSSMSAEDAMIERLDTRPEPVCNRDDDCEGPCDVHGWLTDEELSEELTALIETAHDRYYDYAGEDFDIDHVTAHATPRGWASVTS